jgi:hypothetical protein
LFFNKNKIKNKIKIKKINIKGGFSFRRANWAFVAELN